MRQSPRLAVPCLALLAAGCGSANEPSLVDDTGSAPTWIRRYVVDAITLPQTRAEFAGDLNGDGYLDNQLGSIEGTLAVNHNDGSSVIPWLLLACREVPTVELVGNPDGADAVVEVRWTAASGEAPSRLPGRMEQARFVSTRARATREPVSGMAHLPILSYSDPIGLPLVGMEIELSREGTGFRGELHGAVPPWVDLRPAVFRAMTQMFANDPFGHVDVIRAMDLDHDGRISFEEFEGAPIIANLLAPDIQLFDEAATWRPVRGSSDKDSISIGLGFHITPCAEGCCR